MCVYLVELNHSQRFFKFVSTKNVFTDNKFLKRQWKSRFIFFSVIMIKLTQVDQVTYHSLLVIVIVRLMLSVSLGPKVITLRLVPDNKHQLRSYLIIVGSRHLFVFIRFDIIVKAGNFIIPEKKEKKFFSIFQINRVVQFLPQSIQKIKKDFTSFEVFLLIWYYSFT